MPAKTAPLPPADAAAPPPGAGADAAPLSDEELKKLLGPMYTDTMAAADEVAAGVAPPGEAPPAEGALEEAPAEEAPAEAGAEDVTPIVEALGVDEAKARELYDASQTVPNLEGISPADLARRLEGDMTLLMKLEEVVARKAPAPPAPAEAPAPEGGGAPMEGAEGGEVGGDEETT